MELLKEKVMKVFNTDELVPGGIYQFKVLDLHGTDPRYTTFNAMIANNVDEDCLEIIVSIDTRHNSELYEKLNMFFEEFSIDVPSAMIHYYRISPNMLDGSYSVKVGPLKIEINRLVPEESDD